ncbi:MAG: glycosyltransferase [Tissierella sp.]|uniref:glycosyltransferase n=1 Tax=Tissierella sp. TaxID=41274 RepID=UPI003F9BEB75
MHVLLVARGYPTDKYKTYGIFEYDQAKALAKEGVKVTYAAIDYRSLRRWRKWGVRKIKKDGIDIYSINVPLGQVPLKVLRALSIRGLKKLYKKIEEEQGKPDIIHAHFTNSAYSASFLKDEIDIPLVITEHSSKINTDKIDKNILDSATTAYRSADRVIGVSKSFVDKINSNFDIDAIYIPNIVDLEVFKYKEQIKGDKFKIISTGNLIKLKRMDLLIKAFYEAFKGMENVELKIFGQGVEKSKLRKLIKYYGLESQVELMGLCFREEIADALQRSDLFVLASQSETFGVVCIEALAMGVPVISTKSGGPEGYINEQNGILVDVGDQDQLVSSMKYMYQNADKYSRKDISEEIETRFSGEVVVKEIIKIYKELLKNRYRITKEEIKNG